VDLRDRGGGDRLAERDEQRAHGLAQCGLDGAERHLLGEGRDPVLQLLQVEGGPHADDVRPGRQELAELDVGRAEAGHRRRQAGGAVVEAGPLEGAPDPQGEPQVRRQLGGIGEGEGAFTGQHEADPRAAEQVDGSADHRSRLPSRVAAVKRPSSPNGSPRCRP
jgi:hypothetical protein